MPVFSPLRIGNIKGKSNGAGVIISYNGSRFHVLVNKCSLFSVHTRSMMSQVNSCRISTHLTKPLLPSYYRFKPHNNYTNSFYLRDHSFAYRSVNEPEKNPKDPQSLKNNPYMKNKKRHFEIQRKLCDKPGCINNSCVGLCGNYKTTDSIGHGTHGQSPATETDKKTISLSSTDFNVQKKQQNAVMYKKPHKPSTPTVEHTKGTQQINSDPNIMNNIDQNEDKTIIP